MSILLLPGLLLSIQPGHACSGSELAQKMKIVADASKAAYARSPEADDARKAQVQEIIGRYSGLKGGIGGAGAIDAMCNECNELLAVYN